MRTFLRNFFSHNKDYIVLVVLLFISLFFLLLNKNKSAKKIQLYSFTAYSLFSELFHSASAIFQDHEEIINQKNINAEVMLELAKLRREAIENIELKKRLKLLDSLGSNLISARVVSKLISSTQGNFIINKGSGDNVHRGMPVITEKGFVGIISTTSQNFSIVRTLFNNQLKLAVASQRSNYQGILGWNGRSLLIKDVAPTVDFQLGDVLVTSDLSTIAPENIPVAIVVKKDVSYSKVTINIIAEPIENINSCSFVFVSKIIPNKELEGIKLNLLQGNE